MSTGVLIVGGFIQLFIFKQREKMEKEEKYAVEHIME